VWLAPVTNHHGTARLPVVSVAPRSTRPPNGLGGATRPAMAGSWGVIRCFAPERLAPPGRRPDGVILTRRTAPVREFFL